MKKYIAVFFAILMLLSGCASTSKEVDIISVGEGEFTISPQKFIDRWNEAVDVYQKNNPDDSDAKRIFNFPNFEESGKEMEIKSRGLKVTYTTKQDTSNLSKFEVTYFQPAATNEESMNFGLISGSFPKFMNPNSDFDMSKNFDLQYQGTDSNVAFDGDYKYEYTVVDGALYSLSVSPKW